MSCVGPQTRGKACVLAGADVMIHNGEIGNEIAKHPDIWKDFVGEPSEPYCDMDEQKEKDMIAFLVQHDSAPEPDFVAMDRGFPSHWKRVQQEDMAMAFAGIRSLQRLLFAFREGRSLGQFQIA